MSLNEQERQTVVRLQLEKAHRHRVFKEFTINN